MDKRSWLRRSHTHESLLSADARSASADNRRKTAANAAGVSAQGRNKGTIGQRIKHYCREK